MNELYVRNSKITKNWGGEQLLNITVVQMYDSNIKQ